MLKRICWLERAMMLLWCTRINITMQTTACTDRVVGDILSSWRYDISGITPEMRRDYEQHLVECAHCRSRQRLHRTIDVVLIGLSTVSIAGFLVSPRGHSPGAAFAALGLGGSALVADVVRADHAGSSHRGLADFAADVGTGGGGNASAGLSCRSGDGPSSSAAGSHP